MIRRLAWPATLFVLVATLPAFGQGAFGQEWLNVNVSLDIVGFSVSSSGSAQYACDYCTDFGYIKSGSHTINSGNTGATVASETFGGPAVFSYNGSISGGAAYSNCYQARVSASSNFSASNYINAPVKCAAPPPPPPPPDDGSLEDNCSQDAGCGGSPIVLDVGDEAYQLTSISGGVSFDLANDGMPSQMAWTRLGAENAFLALDRNQNGTIDNGAELFGNYTPLRSGQLAANGFEALGELDENHNGVFDAEDPAWNRVLLWTDRNHDGRSTSDELLGIGASAVTALETDYRWIGRKDRWGNQFRYMAHFRLREGAGAARRACYDVFFRIQ